MQLNFNSLPLNSNHFFLPIRDYDEKNGLASVVNCAKTLFIDHVLPKRHE